MKTTAAIFSLPWPMEAARAVFSLKMGFWAGIEGSLKSVKSDFVACSGLKLPVLSASTSAGTGERLSVTRKETPARNAGRRRIWSTAGKQLTLNQLAKCVFIGVFVCFLLFGWSAFRLTWLLVAVLGA